MEWFRRGTQLFHLALSWSLTPRGGLRLGLSRRPLFIRLLPRLRLALLKVRLVRRRLRLGRGLVCRPLFVRPLLQLCLALLKVRLVLGRGRGLGRRAGVVGVLLRLALSLLKVRLVLGSLGCGRLLPLIAGVVGRG